MNNIDDKELFEKFLRIYWTCDRQPKSNATDFEKSVAYEHMEDLIPIDHLYAIDRMVYG